MKNEIKMIMKIGKNDCENRCKIMNRYSINLPNKNENKMCINDKYYDYCDDFRFEKKGEYKVKLILAFKMKDCKQLFLN